MLPSQERIAIGNRIRDVRTSLGYNQALFSEKMDISVNFLSEIETGKKGFSAETLYNLCHKLNVSADYILLKSAENKVELGSIIALCNELDSNQLDALLNYLSALKTARDNNLQ